MYSEQSSDLFKLKFIRLLNSLDDKNRLFSYIAYLAAPTQYEYKPSTLLSFSDKAFRLWKTFQQDICRELKFDCFNLYSDLNHEIVLFYRKNTLEKHFKKSEIKHFLHKYGYTPGMDINDALKYLSDKFRCRFPHEIGCFLGIPPKDVTGFIEHKGRGCKLSGYWKVYSNINKASKLFSAYDKAREYVVDELTARFISNDKGF